MIRTVFERFAERDRQRVFWTILASKGVALAVLFAAYVGVRWYAFTPAFADGTTPEVPAYVNPLNTVWTLVAAFLNWRYIRRSRFGNSASEARTVRLMNESWIGGRKGGSAFLAVMGVLAIVNGIVRAF